MFLKTEYFQSEHELVFLIFSPLTYNEKHWPYL